MKSLAATDAHAKRSKLVLLDVRSPAEYREAHIPGSHLLPLHELDPAKVAALSGEEPHGLCLVCRSGQRARQAAGKLAEHFDQETLAILEGGIGAWEAAGLPLERGRAGISLERQVRIAAGTLVLLGGLLGLAIHPAFIALSLFVGAGLVFAGLTDWCGMGLLLARMPWNQCRDDSCHFDQ